MTNRLSRAKILRGRGVFADILSEGASNSSGSIRLFAGKTRFRHWKIGFALVRGAGNAAVRNRIKRCMREAFRVRQSLLLGESCGLILLYVGRVPQNTADVDCTKIANDVQNTLEGYTKKNS